jgi:hypothetical protein
VTHTVPDLAAVEHAYTQFLGMRVLARGEVSGVAAASWNAPAAAGCKFLALVPEVGEDTCLRFIEDPAAGLCQPFTSFGWNATEITVQDTDALAARLEDSPFTIIGPPANLKGFEWIRAMQVLGPAGECLYLTDVRGDATLAQARAMVGQVFITVVAGADIEALRHFYAQEFGNPVTPPVAIPIGVISKANALPLDTLYTLALAELPGGTRIELDQYPPVATPRTVQPGHLPPGMCIVSFDAEMPGTTSDIAPFAGYATVCMAGAAGELIELVGRK